MITGGGSNPPLRHFFILKKMIGDNPFPSRDPAALWDMSRLGETPQVRRWPGEFNGDATPIMIEGEPWRGRPTWCFAYYGVPEWATPEKPAPGIVLVHGGLGTAYPEWVRMWVRRGSAAICVDTCGTLPIRTADEKWLVNPEGGPQGWGRIECADEPEREQWAYHAVAAAIRYSGDRVKLYGERIAAYVKEGVPVEEEPVSLARRLICEEGCGMPEALFLALHTVSEHLAEILV